MGTGNDNQAGFEDDEAIRIAALEAQREADEAHRKAVKDAMVNRERLREKAERDKWTPLSPEQQVSLGDLSTI